MCCMEYKTKNIHFINSWQLLKSSASALTIWETVYQMHNVLDIMPQALNILRAITPAADYNECSQIYAKRHTFKICSWLTLSNDEILLEIRPGKFIQCRKRNSIAQRIRYLPESIKYEFKGRQSQWKIVANSWNVLGI